MPSPAQRIQVLLPEKLLAVIKDLCEENGLSMSKQVSLLVKEALDARGIHDGRTNSKNETRELHRSLHLSPAYQKLTWDSFKDRATKMYPPEEEESVTAGFNPAELAKAAEAGGKTMNVVSQKTEQLDQDDLELLNKLKSLKALGLL